MEFALLFLCIHLVLPQDLQDAANVFDVLGRGGREDDDIIEDADSDDVQLLKTSC